MTFPVAKLGEVCSFVRGLTYSKSDEVEFSSNVVVRATNIDLSTHKLDFSELRYISDSIQVKDDKRLKKDDILICTASGSKSHLGKVALVESDLGMAFGGFMGALRVNPKRITPQYLFTFLVGSEFKRHIENLSDGANINNLKFSQIEYLELPLPPLSTQQKIVAKLDAIFAEIDKATAATEANVKNAEALFQSYLTQVFERQYDNNILTTLGEYYDVRDGTHDSPKFYDSGYPLVTSKNLKNGSISFEKIQYISKEDYLSISQRSGVKKGDVLMAMIGTIGNPVVVETDDEFAIKNVALFKTNSNQSPLFLRYYLGSDYVKRKMANDAKGATQKFVGLGYLRSFPISVPVLSSQLSIVRELEEYEQYTNKLSTSYVDKTNQLLAFKQSILNQAFSGELVKE